MADGAQGGRLTRHFQKVCFSGAEQGFTTAPHLSGYCSPCHRDCLSTPVHNTEVQITGYNPHFIDRETGTRESHSQEEAGWWVDLPRLCDSSESKLHALPAPARLLPGSWHTHPSKCYHQAGLRPSGRSFRFLLWTVPGLDPAGIPQDLPGLRHLSGCL